jgi:ABC-type uncharacterized transport system involved in gliding motility auxiliary subunit
MPIMKKITTTASGLMLLVLAVVSLNFIASKINFRFDLTQDKVFSISEGTRSLLGKLERDVTIKLFFSRSLKELPVPVKTYATRVEELLHEYQDASNGRITIEVIDPKPDTDDEEWAQKYGITGVRLPQGDQMFFGLVFLIGTQEMAIPYLDPRREEFLEYDIAEALMSKIKKEPVKVGIMSSLPVMGSQSPVMGPQGPIDDTWAVVNDLRRNFEVSKIETDAKEIPSGIKVLMIIHPKELSEATLYAVDQFVLNGGKLVVAVDPMSRTDMQINANAPKAPGEMPKISSDLEKLLATWDIEYDKNTLVGDTGLATQINAGGQMIRYPFFVTLNDTLLSRQSVITGKLKSMLVAEGGALSHKSGASSKFESLINFSKDSGTASAQSALYTNPVDLARSLKSDGKDRSLAAVVTGTFKTAFPGGAPSGASTLQKHRAEAERETAVVVIADVDLFYDQNAVDKFRFGPQIMIRPRNDNLNFLVNAVDFLGGSEDLIAIRSKGRIARPFTRVAEIQKDAQKRWQAEEESLTNQINELQRKLNEMQAQRTDGNRFALNAEQQAEITKFRDDERRFKKQRRQVRKNLRDDIEQLGRRLIAVNMLFIPMVATGLGASVFYRRSRRFRDDKKGGQK